MLTHQINIWLAGLWRPVDFDERADRRYLTIALAFLALQALGWVGVLPSGLGIFLMPFLFVALWRPLRDMVVSFRRRPGTIVAMGVLSFLVSWGLVGQLYIGQLVPFIGQVLGQPSLASANDASITQLLRSMPLLIPVVCVLAPLQEELLYRYGVFRAGSKISPAVGHTLAALVFAAQHVTTSLLAGDWLQIIPGLGYLASGYVYSLCYARAKNLAAPWLGHVLANTLAVVLTLS